MLDVKEKIAVINAQIALFQVRAENVKTMRGIAYDTGFGRRDAYETAVQLEEDIRGFAGVLSRYEFNVGDENE